MHGMATDMTMTMAPVCAWHDHGVSVTMTMAHMQVRRRSRVEPPATGAAAHSLRGYEGIDIIPTTGGGRDE